MILKLRRKFIKITMLSVILVLFGIIALINVFNYRNVMATADRRLQMLAGNDMWMMHSTHPGSDGSLAEPDPEMNPAYGGDLFEGAEENLDSDTDSDEDLDPDEDSDSEEDMDPDDVFDDDRMQPPGMRDDWMELDDDHKTGLFLSGLNEESPYDSRYFAVILTADGEVLRTDISNIASVDESDAGKYARELYSAGRTEGFYKNYRFAVLDSDMRSSDAQNSDAYSADTEDTITYLFLNCERELASMWNFLLISVIISVIGICLVFLLVLLLSKQAIRPIAENYQKQKQFITDAGHELKTPLTIIGAYAEMIDMDDPGNEYAAGILSQVKRLTDLTNNLIYLSKTEEGSQSLDFHTLSLSVLLRESLEPYEDLASKESMRLTADLEENVSVRGDQQAIRRLISLLMDNALKYTADGGDIDVILKKTGGFAQLSVNNTVSDMEPGDQDILFERFYRRDASRNSETGGSGIGLSTARAIVEAHGGSIHAFSPDGKQFCISIRLKI